MRTSALPLACFLTLACAPPSGTRPDVGAAVDATDAGAPDAGPSEPQEQCSAPTPPECEDDAILELNLQAPVAPGLVENINDSGSFHSTVDATAGGFGANPPHAYVYARFTDEGLEKVEIGDHDSLASMDWDLALQRYRVRINGGDSGPSCVAATRAPPALAWDEVTSVPETATFRTDEYLTSNCTLVPDSSNPIPGAYASALGGFFSYTSERGCLMMTGNIYLVRLRSGRVVKVRFTHYYEDSAQLKCDQGLPFTAAGSGTIQLDWAFLN